MVDAAGPCLYVLVARSLSMWTAVVAAGGGWKPEVMARLLDVPAVLRIDGIGLRPDGKFNELAVHLDSEASLEKFAGLLQRQWPDARVRM